jgi:ribonuclease HII
MSITESRHGGTKVKKRTKFSSPSLLETKLKRRGYKVIVGLDEVGRGALAGPVVACAVAVQKFSIFNFAYSAEAAASAAKARQFSKKLKDSKKLSPKRREEIYKILKNHSQVKWGIGLVSEKVIDKINILQATKLAMKRAVNNLKIKVDFLLIDGNFGINSDVPQKSIVKGDEKIFLIKLASIVAKVTRDRAMVRYHKKYPQYRFDKHKGYGTKLHFELLRKYGPCKIHRKTFSPVRSLKLKTQISKPQLKTQNY